MRIGRYGLAAEVGSLAAAIKKKVLHSAETLWNSPNDEIYEELGDILWYITYLSLLRSDDGLEGVVRADFSALPEEIGNRQAFKAALAPGNFENFLKKSRDILQSTGSCFLDEYQEAAFLTARTQGRDLLDVCVTRLLLYSTSVMSRQFPESEYHLKDDILKFSNDRTLGMMLWHVAAIATVYGMSLDRVSEKNAEKLREISNIGEGSRTSLHDEFTDIPDSQKFPRNFEISFITTGPQRLQMFYEGRPLGDEIDDNSIDEDGYRFHDALHLANAVKLGWSPVLRSLLGRKRKADPAVDRIQDGARARIVEEAVVKAIHSEAIRTAREEGLTEEQAKQRLFSDPTQIPYKFLKLIQNFVDGLEVEKNSIWEWQEAIVEGHHIYRSLYSEKQGTVSLNLVKREISFSPLVIPDIRWPIVDTATEFYTPIQIIGSKLKESQRKTVEVRAILCILGLDETDRKIRDSLRIDYLDGDFSISVKATGSVQAAMWQRSILGFRSSWTKVGRRWMCVMKAVGAPYRHA